MMLSCKHVCQDERRAIMDLYQLECFRVVASMQHISNAAMVLHITQSALRMPLFDRVKGKIYLNESGTIFVRSLDQMFDALNAGLTEIRSSAQFQQYQVYVASNADSLLFHVSEEFFAGHSDTNIKYSVMSPEQIRDGFQHGKLDLALTTYPLIEPGIEWELVLVLGPEHPLAGHKEISFAELKGVEIMCESLGGDLRTMVDRCCAKAGFHANVVLESDIGSAIGFHEGLRRAVTFMPAHRYMQIYQAIQLAKEPPFPAPTAARLRDPVPMRITGVARKSEYTLTAQAQELYDYVLRYFQTINIQVETFMREYFSE